MLPQTFYAALAILPLALAAPTLEKRCAGPAINQASLNLIESYEGYSSTPYSDPSGFPTIGYGHLCSNSACSDVPYPIPLSDADGQKLLQSDLAVSPETNTIS
jgi:lysozyme